MPNNNIFNSFLLNSSVVLGQHAEINQVFKKIKKTVDKTFLQWE